MLEAGGLIKIPEWGARLRRVDPLQSPVILGEEY
jgi:hypothetical protein